MKATIAPPVFVWDGTTDAHPLKPVRSCDRCPMPETRTDIHITPGQTPEQDAADAARLGESEEA